MSDKKEKLEDAIERFSKSANPKQIKALLEEAMNSEMIGYNDGRDEDWPECFYWRHCGDEL